MTDENRNHGCLLPCSKTWLSDVRIITNDRIVFRGRFRGRLIKIDAHRPSRCWLLNTDHLHAYDMYSGSLCCLICWDFSQEQANDLQGQPLIVRGYFEATEFHFLLGRNENWRSDIISPNYLRHAMQKNFVLGPSSGSVGLNALLRWKHGARRPILSCPIHRKAEINWTAED